MKKYLFISEVRVREADWKVYHILGVAPRSSESGYQFPYRGGQIVVTEKSMNPNVDDEEYLKYRLDHGIALQGVDYDQEMLLNLNDEHLVCYTKGCYLGQEIIARVHFRSKPPKKLKVCFESEVTPEKRVQMTSRCFDHERNELRGFVFLQNTG